MSYSFQLEITPEDVDNLYDHLMGKAIEIGTYGHQTNNGTQDEFSRSLATQANAIRSLLDAMPNNWAVLYVSVGGHCEPGGVQRPGWSADSRNVNIWVKSFKE
jgi:hypothetical protein